MEGHILDSAGMETRLVDSIWNHCAEGYRGVFDDFFSLSLFLFFSFFLSLIYCCAKSMNGGLREAVAGIEIFGSVTLVDREVGICTLMLVDILGPSA